MSVRVWVYLRRVRGREGAVMTNPIGICSSGGPMRAKDCYICEHAGPHPGVSHEEAMAQEQREYNHHCVLRGIDKMSQAERKEVREYLDLLEKGNV